MNNNNHEIDGICSDDCQAIKAYIQIHYGPYISCGILRHRIRRLQNLVDALEGMGHMVDLIPSNLSHRVEINICGRTIYRLRLTHLEIRLHPASMKANIICRQAICAITEALTRMRNAALKEGLIYDRRI